jgi:hypothetical protein
MEEDRLQDFAEGLLDPEMELEVRRHLEGCPRCREELERVSSLIDDLGDLPIEAEPSRDLWPQIAWRIEAGRKEMEAEIGRGGRADQSDVGRAPSNLEPLEVRTRARRRITLPAWQLLAASITLMIVSGGVVWTFLSARVDAGPSGYPLVDSPAVLAAWGDAYGGYDQALADLEDVLEKGRDLLDPETVRVLEESLQSIDEAIQEATDALAQDPASTVLRRFLADSLRKKMDLLRIAAMAVYSNT